MSEAVKLARTTFPAEPPRRLSRVLVGFLALSLLAHGLAFFLFQVVYPPAVGIAPPTPSVSLLTPSTPEQEAFLRWIAAEDPALVASSVSAEPPLVLSQGYQPSYATLRTAARTVPLEEPATVLAPTMRILASPTLPAPTAPKAAPVPAATRVLLGGVLSQAAVQNLGEVRLRSGTALPAATYLLGVNERGQVQFALVQTGSGDSEADLTGARALLAARIEPAPPKLTWAPAYLNWGAEAYPATVAAPAP